MNILKRLDTLSADDLHKLQFAVLTEIHRRKQIAAHKADILLIDAEKQGKGGHSAPASKARPVVTPPAPKRRAA
jgi:hypothetical protein